PAGAKDKGKHYAITNQISDPCPYQHSKNAGEVVASNQSENIAYRQRSNGNEVKTCIALSHKRALINLRHGANGAIDSQNSEHLPRKRVSLVIEQIDNKYGEKRN